VLLFRSFSRGTRALRTTSSNCTVSTGRSMVPRRPSSSKSQINRSIRPAEATDASHIFLSFIIQPRPRCSINSVLKPLIAAAARANHARCCSKNCRGPDRFLEFAVRSSTRRSRFSACCRNISRVSASARSVRLSSVISRAIFDAPTIFSLGRASAKRTRKRRAARLPWLPGPSDNGRWIRRV